MSIVQALLDAVERELATYPGAQVRSVRVRVGSLRQVVPDMLTFCFTAATRATPLAASKLELEAVPALVRCRQCRHEFPVEENWFACPACQALDGELLRGDELELVSLEVEPCPTLQPA